jgi:HAD superfamily hydrolase (TIGR01509 family)
MSHTTKPIRAVLFDMDGVLTDTEKYYNKAWVQAFHEAGYEEFTADDALFHRSLNSHDARIMYKERYGSDFDYDGTHKRANALVKEWLAIDGIPVKPGINEILSYLEEHHIWNAVVTATEYENAVRRLTTAGIHDKFKIVISAHNVPKGKPHPDPYLFAIQELSKIAEAAGEAPITADDAFAVEDSPNGITSATSAGLKTIMVPDLSQPDDELKKKLHAVCHDLTEVIDVIENTNK